MSDNTPLVSVVVLTYNSSKTVLETLDSIKNQTYPSIQLVVGDDCSTDNTREVVQSWINENSDRFEEAVLVKTPQNGGVTMNKTNAYKSVRGEWVKGIAADDRLKPQCLEIFLQQAKETGEKFFSCQLDLFSTSDADLQTGQELYDNYFKYICEPQEKQWHRLVYDKYYIPGPSLFYSMDLYREVDGCDTRFAMWEEYSFVYRVLSAGYRLTPVYEKLVEYRYEENSLCRANSDQKPRPSYMKYVNDKRLCFWYYQFWRWFFNGHFCAAMDNASKLGQTCFIHRHWDTPFLVKMSRVYQLFSPSWYRSKINRLLGRKNG